MRKNTQKGKRCEEEAVGNFPFLSHSSFTFYHLLFAPHQLNSVMAGSTAFTVMK